MSHFLIVYGTSHGQTEKIVHRVAEVVRGAGHVVSVYRGDRLPPDLSVDAHDAVIVAGSVQFGRYQRYLARFVHDHVAALNARPSAFISVCGALAGTWKEGPAHAATYVDKFQRRTGWHPQLVTKLAGAIKYTEYRWLLRQVMRMISRRTGRPTDTSRDYEFTNWDDVERFALRAVNLVAAAHPPPAVPAPI